VNDCKPLGRTRGAGGPLGDAVADGRAAQGVAVQLDPIKPKLKPSETKRLVLEYDGLLSKLGFKTNLRRYIKEYAHRHDIAVVGRCRLTLSNQR